MSEEQVYQLWNVNGIFNKTIDQNKNKGKPVYGFYDGPPFATGLPHYGHILAGFIKDSVLRYHHNLGKDVPRYAGWDCIAEGTKINLSDGTSIPIEQFEKYFRKCSVNITYSIIKIISYKYFTSFYIFLFIYRRIFYFFIRKNRG